MLCRVRPDLIPSLVHWTVLRKTKKFTKASVVRCNIKLWPGGILRREFEKRGYIRKGSNLRMIFYLIISKIGIESGELELEGKPVLSHAR